MNARNLLALVLSACLAAAAPAAHAEVMSSQPAGPTRELTLEQCIDIALRRNPDVIVAEEEVVASVAAKNGIRGNFGPKGRVEGSVIRWDSALTSEALTGGTPIPAPFDTMFGSGALRDTNTTTLTLTVAQPLGALWSIYEGYKVRELGVDVAKIRRQVAFRDTAYQATEAFYRTLQAIRLAEVGQMSVEQLEAQVQRARSFYSHGLIGNTNLLRAELGLASARQRLIVARGQVTLAQGRLAYVLGLPANRVIVPTGAPAAPPPPENLTAAEAERRALTSRVEIRELDDRILQAQHGVRAAWSKMLPDLNGFFSYQRNTGSAFQPNAYFGGINFVWNMWEWGATYYGIPEAKARYRQALAARTKVADGITLETRSAFVTAVSAAEALGVARSAVVQAEENYRLESKRYEAHANTSFDLVDAETQLTQARAQLQTALYDYLIARAALARAMGEEPVVSRMRASGPASPEGTHAVP